MLRFEKVKLKVEIFICECDIEDFEIVDFKFLVKGIYEVYLKSFNMNKVKVWVIFLGKVSNNLFFVIYDMEILCMVEKILVVKLVVNGI